MATRTITTVLGLDGEQEFKQGLQAANREIGNLKNEMKLAEAQFKGQTDSVEFLTEKDRILREEIAQQEEKVRALNKMVEEAAAVYGEADKRTDNYRSSLLKAKAQLVGMTDALEENTRELEDARRSAEQTEEAFDDLGDSAGDVGPGMDDLVKQLGNLKNMVMGGAIVTGIKEVAGMVLELEESTREYRQIMGTLETSSQAAGYSAEETAELYGRMHSVIGDTQAAAEASALLQALKLNTDDLNTASYTTIGMWTELGQSAPIESIAEATQQTISAGQATGALADWLAIAGIQEEEFNAKLEATNGATERAQIVLQTLADHGLVDAGQAWMDINQDIVKANESQAKMEAAMGRMGELVAPLANGLRDLGANAIEWLADKIEDLLPMLETMAEVAGKVWDAVTAGKEVNAFTSGQYGSRTADGSHAGGLSRVPYDGYLAETHKDEAILTAGEAEWWRSVRQGLPQQSRGVSVSELQAVTAAAVNAVTVDRQSSGKQVFEIKMIVNGREFFQETLEDLRAVEKSNPEVSSDR